MSNEMSKLVDLKTYKRFNGEWWIGKKVRTLKELSNGYIKIPEGTIMTIFDKSRGVKYEQPKVEGKEPKYKRMGPSGRCSSYKGW